jgi:hypothetical protein
MGRDGFLSACDCMSGRKGPTFVGRLSIGFASGSMPTTDLPIVRGSRVAAVVVECVTLDPPKIFLKRVGPVSRPSVQPQ